ncbi:MAG: DEAD/DEAH box helicase, partial [Actinomycetota bacterium]|nr:DEAD/DEAH box helicase [Actinomycetota bacterium]
MNILDPLAASRRIASSYRRYILSSFSPRRGDLQRELQHALDYDFRLSKGPFLQASAPFVTGASVADLVAEGVLSTGFRRLTGTAFPVDRPLYVHQEQAIRRSVRGRNLVIATGTGSGKTEGFLLPIVDQLLREAEAGTLAEPGVRALLLYPMNAQAKDQVKRLRTLLSDLPEITFGRYVGETPTDDARAEENFMVRFPGEPRLPNELLSRDRMQEAPPHILLTNYAMLEYLLLRPADSALFDGLKGRHWRTIVLDEAHVYNGAQGTEVAMLLRRVRDRVVRSERGRLRCFATSATLGRGVQDYPQLVRFASDLFDEKFDWDPDDVEQQDVIGALRKP